MEELGISDVDDISEISEGVEQPPPLPASPPPKTATSNPNLAGNDWDSSVLSDITTPRPGILKNWNNTGLGDSGEVGKTAATVLLQAPDVDSGDDNSDWDTTETTQNAVPQIKPSLQSPRGKDSVSEWDSELEDMVDPANSSNFVPPSSSFTQKTTAVNVKDGEWDMIDGHNPKPNGHLYLYEDQEDNPTQVAVQPDAEFDIEPTHPALTREVVVDRGQRGEDSNSDWDSEADEQSMENEPPAYIIGESSLPQNLSSPVHKQAKGQSDQQQTSNSEDESESMSSWEVERKKQKHVSLNSPARQREMEEEARSREQEELERLYREQQEEMVRKEKEDERIRLEEQMRIQREEEVRLQKQKEEEEIKRIKKEEEDLRKRQREEEERIKKLREEENMLKRRKEEEEKIQKQREAEDKLIQQREEEEKRRKPNEEEQRMRKQKEEEEKIRKQKELIQLQEELDENETQEWEVEERQEILDRQWEIEESKKEEQLKRNVEEVMERQSLGKAEAQEMIFFQSVKDLDQTEQRRGLVEKLNEKSFPRGDRVEEEGKHILTSPPFKPPPPPKPSVGVKSPGTFPYAGGGPTSNVVGGSTVEQIKQRLQVPQMTSTGSSYTSPNMFSVDPYDDNESQLSDNPGDERPSLPTSYYQGMYRHNDALDDDALSYTSTEFEDQVHSTPSYGKDREVLTNINLSDPSSLIKVQEYVRETRRQLEQEKNQRVVLENKLKVATKEKTEIHKKLESINREKSNLEQTRLDLEAKIRSLEYSLTDEEEKRKNAQILLSKTKEQLDRKETQYASELESRQKMELTMRNLQIEIRTATNTIKELMEEKEELERKVSQANNSQHFQEKLWEDQKKLISQLQEHTPREQENSSLESTRESFVETDRLQAELYAVKMEMDRQRSRFKDNIAMFEGENEILNAKVDELRNEIKLNEEALVQASQMYSLQLSSLKAELSSAHSVMEKEKSSREKLEAEIDSLKTRLLSTNHEMDKAISARNELEREHRREKELWNKEMERKSGEVTALKDDNQHLNQRLHATEGRLNTIENELHVSNTSLMERTAQLQQLKQELDRHKSTHESLDQNYRMEKENNAKLQAKVENMQDKVSAQQQDNFSLRQQLDSLKLNAGSSPGSDANEKLSNILASLRADSDRAKATLEEKNNNLVEQVARLKEEVRGAEAKRVTLEQDLKRLQEEHNALIKKLSQTEASLQIAGGGGGGWAKEQAEQERIQLKSEVERLQHKYQSTHDKSVESQARISELVDRLEKAEHTSLYSNQQLANTSANMQGLTKTKTQLDESMQHLQIENTKLEAELKYEKQRADMLYQDLQDSQKVRSSLEALCANLKSSSAHIEDRLGSENGYEDSRLEEEIAARVMYEAEARDHKNLYDLEMKSRSKLGLRIADLERNKHSSDAKLGEEKNRAQMADEKLRYLESQLEAEKEKNHQLQKDMNSLKHHLKSAKNKIKETREFSPLDPQYTEFQKDVSSKEIFVSTPRNQSQGSANIEDMKSELEAKYRMELNRKLDDVNRFLESQSQMRDRLDTSRTDLETSLMFDKRKLEEENNNLRVKYEQALAQRETKEMEVKRFRELYESEMKWRLRVSDQLTLATEKSFNLKSKLNNERHHRSRITGSIGNLNSSVVSNGFDITRVNGFEDDDLSNKIKAELDRSIAKHLEAAPHDLKKPVLRTTKDAPRFSSSLAQSSNDYFDILKRKYCV
ncbi:unnamed protein product [Lymnaea stagnalis]|uniref:CCDC144C-like coiled-coil domain-containing protein n=1 Tax=Lymnaea stagnalis TaxID=6523 RepID=A0AAV2H104_LYMST